MNELIATAKESVIIAKNGFLSTFSHVPDEKLSWSPAQTSKSPLHIAAHAGVVNDRIAGLIRGEKPAESMSGFLDDIRAQELAITSREQAVRQIEESTQRVLRAIDDLTPSRLSGDVHLPIGSIAMSLFVLFPTRHFDLHAGQIDYVETIWGDLEVYL